VICEATGMFGIEHHLGQRSM